MIESFLNTLFGDGGVVGNVLSFIRQWFGIVNQNDTSIVGYLGKFVPLTILPVVALYVTVNFAIHIYHVIRP